MDILSYTTYDEIRQVVGLSVMELTDAELGAEMYANSLQLRLRGITLPDTDPGPGPLDSRFLDIKQINEASRTAPQQELYNLTRLFSTYAVAYEVSISLGLRTPKTESDGKRTLTRFSPEAAFMDTARNILRMLDSLKQQIELFADPVAVTLPLLTVIPPAIDVVTGE